MPLEVKNSTYSGNKLKKNWWRMKKIEGNRRLKVSNMKFNTKCELKLIYNFKNKTMLFNFIVVIKNYFFCCLLYERFWGDFVCCHSSAWTLRHGANDGKLSKNLNHFLSFSPGALPTALSFYWPGGWVWSCFSWQVEFGRDP